MRNFEHDKLLESHSHYLSLARTKQEHLTLHLSGLSTLLLFVRLNLRRGVTIVPPSVHRTSFVTVQPGSVTAKCYQIASCDGAILKFNVVAFWHFSLTMIYIEPLLTCGLLTLLHYRYLPRRRVVSAVVDQSPFVIRQLDRDLIFAGRPARKPDRLPFIDKR